MEVSNGCIWKATILLEIHPLFTEPWLWDEGYFCWTSLLMLAAPKKSARLIVVKQNQKNLCQVTLHVNHLVKSIIVLRKGAMIASGSRSCWGIHWDAKALQVIEIPSRNISSHDPFVTSQHPGRSDSHPIHHLLPKWDKKYTKYIPSLQLTATAPANWRMHQTLSSFPLGLPDFFFRGCMY